MVWVGSRDWKRHTISNANRLDEEKPWLLEITYYQFIILNHFWASCIQVPRFNGKYLSFGTHLLQLTAIACLFSFPNICEDKRKMEISINSKIYKSGQMQFPTSLLKPFQLSGENDYTVALWTYCRALFVDNEIIICNYWLEHSKTIRNVAAQWPPWLARPVDFV